MQDGLRLVYQHFNAFWTPRKQFVMRENPQVYLRHETTYGEG